MAYVVVLSKAIKEFLGNQNVRGVPKRVVNDYAIHLDIFLEWAGDHSIRSMDADTIEDFFEFLMLVHHVPNGRYPFDKRLKPREFAKLRRTLASFWDWAWKEYKVSNPFTERPIQSRFISVAPLTENMFVRLIDACKETIKKRSGSVSTSTVQQNMYHRNRAILLIMLDSGVLASELCELKIRNVDFNTGQIAIEGKNRWRNMYVGRKTNSELFTYLRGRFPRGKFDPNQPLFTTVDGRPMSQATIGDLLHRLSRRAGVNVNPYRLRVTYAVEFLKNGGDAETLKVFLGYIGVDRMRLGRNITDEDVRRVHQEASPGNHLEFE